MADRETIDRAPAFPAHAVAIVGMAGRFPGAPTLDAFWRLIRDGVEALEDVGEADLDAAGVPPELRRDPRYVRKGTWLERSRHWDAAFFGYSPREAQVIDPQHRIFMECAVEALEHAGYGERNADAIVGVYAGASMNTWLMSQLLRDPELLASAGGYQLMIGNDKDFLCTRASYKLDLRGPSMTIQTACSTSLVAVEAACRALASRECDMALAGGVSVSFPERAGYLHQEGMIFSPDGHCRPFDERAAGTRAGAGAGLVVLKRFEDAWRDGDTIHAVIRGIAVNNDGAAKAGYTAPSLEGQVEVIAAAQALADVEPRSIGYVEAHGTATPLGDPIEIAALTAAFRAGTEDVGFCRLGSLKANLGHLDAAAGVAGLIKAALVLKHRELPPLVNFTKPNPALALEVSPFSASAAGEAWAAQGPRRAAVSSFGIGGTNAHAVLEEAPVRIPADVDRVGGPRDEYLVVVSARSEAALAEATTQLADHLAATKQPLADVAYTLQVGRTAYPLRRSIVAADEVEAAERLHAALGTPPARHEGGDRPVAFLFPGQGSQHPGMGRALYATEPLYSDIVDRCAALLQPELGLDLRDVLHGEDAEILRATRVAQPALFVTSYALARLWQARGVRPAAMLGHSIGEYAAATLAGVFTLEDALRVVAARGRLMQAMPPGAMAGVAASPEQLRPLLDPRVEIAAINAPDLCTISGPADAMARTLDAFAAKGLSGRPLQTSHAFHSGMMDPILGEFEALLRDVSLSAPTIPYVSNLTGTWITEAEARDPRTYARQLRAPVRFADGLRCLAGDPSLFFLECGPGQALTQLAIANLGPGALVAPSLPRASGGEAETRTVLDTTGRLWRAGVPVDFAALHDGKGRVRTPLPTYPFQRQLHDVQPRSAASPLLAAVQGEGLRYNAPTWTRDPAGTPAPTLNGRWLVCGGAQSLRAAVADAVDRAGAHATALPDFAALRSLIDSPGPLHRMDGAILLDGLSAGSGEALLTDLLSLAALAGKPSLAPTFRLVAAVAGTAAVFNERAADVDAALALGAALVLPLEAPQLAIRLVDLDVSGGDTVTALLAEAGAADDERHVAWRGGRRWLRRFETITPTLGPSILRDRGVYLITGGLGGLGLLLAEWLASSCRARLILTSRRAPSPDRLRESQDPRDIALAQALSRIEAAGGEVLLAAADAADEQAMAAALAAGRDRWGALNGVIHGAGVPGPGKLAAHLTPEDVAATLAPKRGGLAALRTLLAGAELDFVALMGSINGVLGAPWAADYSAANTVLDAFAELGERPAGWRRVVSMDWGPWLQVGMAHDLALARSGGKTPTPDAGLGIAPAKGVEAFAYLLGGPYERIVITAFDLAAAIAASRAGTAPEAESLPALDEAPAGSARPALSTPFTPPAEGTERQLAAIWSQLIGVGNLGADDDFFELGGHSLMATRMLARIEALFGVKLGLRDVFEAPTIRTLAVRIMPGAADEADDDREEIFL